MENTKNDFTRIVCAVRGVPESRETVSHAIHLAVEKNAQLTFFLVIDAEFIGLATPTMSTYKIVYEQLDEMSQFAMMILSDRAKRRGVKDVDYAIRRGNVPREIRAFVEETDPDILVIGSPLNRPGYSIFKPGEFDEFVYSMEKITQVQVVKLPPRGGS